MGDAGTNEGKITLYTNHGCPWAHRAHIVLRELGLKYDEVLIDLDVPREQWFLDINPRGLVPTITYAHHDLPNSPVTVVESGLVVSFLLDTFASNPKAASIWPPPKDAAAAYFRYRVNFFVDTYLSKVNSLYFKMLFAEGSERESKVDDIVTAMKTQIEPLLHDAGPFFGGSQSITLAEVLTASFILRLYDFTDGDLQPKSLVEKLDQLPNFSKWAKVVRAQDSVTYIWNREKMLAKVKDSIPKLKAKYGK